MRKANALLVTDLSFQEISLFHHLIEILMFLIRYHLFRSKIFIFSEGLPARIAQLLACPQKHLKLSKFPKDVVIGSCADVRLAALKFFRTCIGLQDDYYIQQMTRNFLFEPILNIVYDTMPRDNLLNSVCLELFEFVKRENIKAIILHIVGNYREKLQTIRYVDTFQTLILRYDQFQGYNPEGDTTLFGQDQDETPSRSNVSGNHRWQGVKEMDAAEEAYFNTSDDEDELAHKKPHGQRHPLVNGVSPLARSLVDYPDDEEEPMNADAGLAERKPVEKMNAQAVDENGISAVSVPSKPPPERLSEKRRREEDEEDELGKLSTSKRRTSSVSSTSSGISVGSNSSNMLRRKKAFISTNKDTAASSDKIKILLATRASSDNDTKRD